MSNRLGNGTVGADTSIAAVKVITRVHQTLIWERTRHAQLAIAWTAFTPVTPRSWGEVGAVAR